MVANNNNKRFNSCGEAQVVATPTFSDLSIDVNHIKDKLHEIESQGFFDIFENLEKGSFSVTQFLSNENLDKFDRILGNIQGFSETLNNIDQKRVSKILLILAVVWSIKEKARTLLTLASAYVAYVHRDDIKSVISSLNMIPDLERIFSLFSDEPEAHEIEPQGSLDTLGPEIATILGMFLMGSKGKVSSKNLIPVLKDFSIVKGSLQSITNVVIKIIEIILANFGFSSIYEKLFHVLNNSSEIYIQFSERVFEIDTQYEQKKLTFTIDNYEILAELLRNGEQLLRDLPRHNTTSGLFSTLNGAVSRLRTYKKAFSDSGFLVEGLRQEPVAVLLRGGPGTFKTQTMQHLAHALVSSVVDNALRPSFENNPERFIYNRQIETEYWDGYDHDKIVTMFDDLLQMRDVATGGDSEVFNVIRGVNENGYDLHMASMDNKGSTKFRSKFIIATTNSANLNTQSIHDPRALLRRFKKTYTVVPKAGYSAQKDGFIDLMNQKVDVSKLPLGPLNISSTNPDNILEFHEYDLLNRRPTGEVVSFKEMVNILVKQHDFNKLAYEQKVIELGERRREFSNEMQIGFSWIKDKFTKALSYDVPIQDTSSQFYTLVQEFDDDEFFQISTMFKNLSNKDRTSFVQRSIYMMGELHTINPLVSDGVYFHKLQTLYGDDFYELILDSSRPCTITAFLADKPEFLEDIPIYVKPVRVVSNNKQSVVDKVKNCLKSFKDSISKLGEYNDWSSWKQVLTSTKTISSLVLLFVATAGYTGYKKITQKVSQGEYKMKPKKVVAKKVNAAKLRQMAIQPQHSLINDPQGEDIIKKITKTNLYEFSIKIDDEDYRKCGYTLFVKGNVGVVPHHFMDVVVNATFDTKQFDNTYVRLRGAFNSKNGFHEVIYKLSELVSCCYDTPTMEAQDLLCVVFKDFSPRPDITKYLATAKDLNSFKKEVCVLASAGDDYSYTNLMGNVIEEIYVSGGDIEDYYIARGVSYTATTRKGDCGSILGVLNPNEPRRKIFGLHVAGSPTMGKGYSSTFCVEDITECLKNVKEANLIVTEMQCYSLDGSSNLVGDGRFGYVRTVDQSPTLASKTKLMHSNLYGLITETFTKPAHLKPKRIDGVLNNPWEVALKNYSSVWPVMDRDIINDATENYRDFLFSASERPQEKRLFSFEESIVGIPGTEFDSINRRTSPGYPAVVLDPKGNKGKTWYFGDGDEFNLGSESCISLKEDIELSIVRAEGLIRDEHIFMDCLKDELRPIEKVDEFKTRLISASPLKLLLMYRMYFGAYMLWYKINRIDNQSAIGVNVFCEEWDLIAKKFSRLSPGSSRGIGAGDYSKFDGSEKPIIHNKILEVINEWYGDCTENQNVRKVLWMELTNSLHIQGNCIYEWYTSLPSGHPLTPIVNTMYNGIAFRYCWMRAHQDTPDMYKFNEKCYLIALGDDNVFSVHEDNRETFNEVVVGKYMSELGLTYTSETKDGLNAELRSLDKVEFLKRSWRYENIVRRFVAPLRIDGLLDTISWTKRGNQCDRITEDKVDNALRELSLHGKEVYSSWSSKISNVSKDTVNYWPKTTSFTRNLLEVCDREEYC